MARLIVLIIVSIIAINAQEVKINPNNNKKLMGSLGSFASSNIYLCYLNVDLLSEGVINKKIEANKSAKLILSIQQVINQLDQNLRELHEIAESNQDASLIYRLIYIAEKMKEDAKNLETYIKDQTDKNLKEYKKTHNSVFVSLQALFTPKQK